MDGVGLFLVISVTITLILISLMCFFSYKNYKETKEEVNSPHVVHNHIHIIGGTAHNVVDLSKRSYKRQDDNSNKSEISNGGGSNLENYSNMTPHSSSVDIPVEELDDENLHYQDYEEENEEETAVDTNRSGL